MVREDKKETALEAIAGRIQGLTADIEGIISEIGQFDLGPEGEYREPDLQLVEQVDKAKAKLRQLENEKAQLLSGAETLEAQAKKSQQEGGADSDIDQALKASSDLAENVSRLVKRVAAQGELVRDLEAKLAEGRAQACEARRERVLSYVALVSECVPGLGATSGVVFLAYEGLGKTLANLRAAIRGHVSELDRKIEGFRVDRDKGKPQQPSESVPSITFDDPTGSPPPAQHERELRTISVAIGGGSFLNVVACEREVERAVAEYPEHAEKIRDQVGRHIRAANAN